MKTTLWIILACCLAGACFLLFRSDTQTIVNAPVRPGPIVCFGDSLTYGTGASEEMAYPSQLAAMIDRPVINEGIPGETTADAIQRLDDIIALNPAAVLLTLGGNDLKNGVPKERAFANLETIITRLQATGALVVVGGISIPFRSRGFDEAYQETAQKTGAVLVPNVLDNILGDQRLMSDPIHPNGEGYTVMAGHFYRAISPYL